jgi:hypothetical protein
MPAHYLYLAILSYFSGSNADNLPQTSDAYLNLVEFPTVTYESTYQAIPNPEFNLLLSCKFNRFCLRRKANPNSTWSPLFNK